MYPNRFFFPPPPQQPHPGPWPVRLGLSALRSLVSCAPLIALLIEARPGAVSITRGAGVAHLGQLQGLSKSTIGAISVKVPQLAQLYS